MRTTLSLDDDVAAMLQTARKQQKKSFKQVINDALRAGLEKQRRPARRTTRFRTASAKLGRCLVGDIDDVAEVLALAEGESFS
ncbi:MAG: DUF2191 domain-containing protein [Chthoniobacterales bacterium]|nr:DUF2191 domain-containing protein [Chthoniobacterales bacterium]